MRSIDWSKSPLGPVSGWPTTLRTTVGIMLASRFAMRILWGPELIFLHNDAYRPVLGASKYPGAMGRRTADSFPELWHVVGPMFERVMAGEAVALADGILPLDRHGYLEECFFTLSYSPLSDDRGGIGGVLGIVYETTERVLAERRLQTLRRLASGLSTAGTPEEACRVARDVFAESSAEVPFALFYLRDGDQRSVRLVAHTGLDDRPSARPARLPLGESGDPGSWPLVPPAPGVRSWTIRDVQARFGALHGGPYPEAIAGATVLALERPGAGAPYGYLVAGLNPRRAFDGAYHDFFELAGEHIVAAIANATAMAYAESERKRLKSFLLEAPAAIAVLRGPDLVFDLANARYCQLVGKGAPELLGKPGREAVPELVVQGVWDLLDQFHASGAPVAAREFAVEAGRGDHGRREIGYFDWIAQVTRDAHGIIDGLMFFAVEVTEQVLARRSLEGARQFLEGVINQMPAGILIAEAPSGKTLLSNALAESILGHAGLSTASIDPFGAYTAFHLDGRPYATSEFPLVRALRGERVLEEEVELVRPDGARRTVSVNSAPIYDAAGTLVAGVSAFADITDRKRTELALRDSEERGRAIVAALEEGIVLRGIDGTVLFANASAERLLGLASHQMTPLRSAAPGWRAAVRVDGTTFPVDEQAPLRALREGRALSNEIIGIHRSDGRLMWLSVNAQPLFDREGMVSGVVSSFFDITESKTAEEERQVLFARAESARQAAESASRAKDEFLAIVSHELRNPLNAILGWTRLLRAGTLSPERAARALETIERNAISQAQLVEDLLDVSRVISGKLPLDVQTVPLARVIEAAVDSARPAIEAKGLRLNLVLDSEGVLSGDPGRLQQIVWNLLTNATKFTPRGGAIHVVLRRDDSHLELSVTDTGQGISPTFIDQIFDRFKQADSSTTRQQGGLGLGLAIAKNLVEMHGGTIEARSDGIGRGATFVVRVPVAAMRRSPAPQPPRRLADPPVTFQPPPELRGVRILVVDDEPDARELVTAVLAECGAVVRTAPSAALAIAAVEQDAPDVLLCDIGMPFEDGYSLIARVRALPTARGGAMPAACLTGYTTVDDRRRALLAGFNMHLAKPIEPSELIAVAANLSRLSNAIRNGSPRS
jgi:PAS domain S-box-containing protein